MQVGMNVGKVLDLDPPPLSEIFPARQVISGPAVPRTLRGVGVRSLSGHGRLLGSEGTPTPEMCLSCKGGRVQGWIQLVPDYGVVLSCQPSVSTVVSGL